MRENIAISEKEVAVIVFLAMIFSVCESLSIEFNNFFCNYFIFGYKLSFNVSVVFFCIGFFVIDLVTELYNNKFANYFIFSKIISQCVFILFGIVGVSAEKIHGGQIAHTFLVAPRILFDSMIASFFGYKVTGNLMQVLKIKFNGRFLFTRYFSSTFPGEVVFSLIFTLLSFSDKGGFLDILNIFVGLIFVKLVFSLIFSVLVVPITNLIEFYFEIPGDEIDIKQVQFK
jgi:uncharacterized PurR-regulated membrane protein YhhQ (DUF165 family)